MNIPAAKASVDKVEESRKIADMASDESQKQKQEVIEWAEKQPRIVHSTTLMDLNHPKNSKLEQKFKDRVVLSGDVVKDDCGSFAVFTGQGSSASQMTATKVQNVAARLLECAGQAGDAVSACTQHGRRSRIAATFRSEDVGTHGSVYHDARGH